MSTEQIINAIELCKGNPIEKVLKIFEMGMWRNEEIADMAKYFGCPATKESVAECLSKGGVKPVAEETTEVEDLPEDLPETNEGEDTAESTDEKPSEESNEDESADEGEESEGEEEEEKPAGSAEKKTDTKGKDKKAEKPKEEFKSNLPTGLSFNPLVMAIKPFYDKLIAEDEIFANVVREREIRKEKPKSLAECAEYIMSEAYNYAKSHRNGNFGMAGFPDEDMYRLIRHYYDEEFLEVHKVTNAKAVVSAVPTPKSPAKGKEKEKPQPPKPKNNVIDITKSITAKPKAEEGKKVKKEKKKDNLLAGFVPMERPNLETYEKDAKRGSRQQAKSVEQPTLALDW